MAAGGPRRCTERPWDQWVAALARERARDADAPESRAPPVTAARGRPALPGDSMPLHGQLPAAPPLLALCALCGAAIALCAAQAHLMERHPAPLPPPPPPVPQAPSRHKRRNRPHAESHPAEPAIPDEPTPPPAAPTIAPVTTAPPPEPRVFDAPPSRVSRTTGRATSPWTNRTETFESERKPVPPPEIFSEEIADERPVEMAPSPARDVVHPTPAKSKVKSGKSASNRPKYAAREYDPDKHCGVVTGDGSKPCTRSLTCKSHALSLRRLVAGRTKPFDALLAEHRAAKQGVPPMAVSPLTAGATVVPPPVLSPISTPTGTESIVPTFASPSPERKPPTTFYATAPPAEATTIAIPTEVDAVPSITRDIVARLGEPPPPPPPKIRAPEYRPSDVHWYTNGPRPLATCTFSACQMGNALLLSRRLATVRSDFKSTAMRHKTKNASNGLFDFTQTALPTVAKAAQTNSASKFSMPKVRKLIMTCPGFSGSNDTDRNSFIDRNGGRNGHLFAGKRPLLNDFKDDNKCMRTGGPGVDSARNDLKMSKRSNQTDMLELNFMFDPLMADEKC